MFASPGGKTGCLFTIFPIMTLVETRTGLLSVAFRALGIAAKRTTAITTYASCHRRVASMNLGRLPLEACLLEACRALARSGSAQCIAVHLVATFLCLRLGTQSSQLLRLRSQALCCRRIRFWNEFAHAVYSRTAWAGSAWTRQVTSRTTALAQPHRMLYKNLFTHRD